MPVRRRRVLALAGAGAMPALAGCTPCGETWTAGFDVQEPADLPGAVRVRHLDRDGETTAERRLEVRESA